MRRRYSAFVRLIVENGNFPNNSVLPTLFYKNVLKDTSPKAVKELFKQNQWNRAWTDKIYRFHHYHSNTHEVLGICKGRCDVELGGPNGYIFQIERGDVLILPVGVSHKNVACTQDLVVVGAYPSNISQSYNIYFGKTQERSKAEQEINCTILPDLDPVFAKIGLVHDYWKHQFKL